MIFMKKLKTWFFSLFIIIILTISATSTGVLSKNIMNHLRRNLLLLLLLVTLLNGVVVGLVH